jgi:serine phosphatase RsbU (regulator of sigma subunit)
VDNSTKKADDLYQQAWRLRYSDTKAGLQLSLQAGEISQKLSYPRGIAYGLLHRAAFHFLLSLEDSFLENLKTALRFFESDNDLPGQVRALNFLGNIYDSYGDYENALKSCIKGLKILATADLKEEEADLLSTIGLVYNRLSDYDKAIESFQKGLVIRQNLNNAAAVASSLNLIARTHALKGDYQEALEFYKKSLQLRESQKDSTGLPWNYVGLASLYEKMNELDNAIEHYEKGLQLNVDLADKRCELNCYLGMGKVYIKMKNPGRGAHFLERALDVATILQSKPLLYEIHFSLAEAYELEKNLPLALKHFKLYHSIKEEVFNSETNNKLKNQQIAFAVERSEQEAEIYRLRNVELKEAYEKIEEKNKDISDSINYAEKIQKAMLPLDHEIKEGLPQSFVLFRPKDVVSGDFYWFSKNKNSIVIAAADCTGHGVPGAFMSMIGSSLLDRNVKQNDITQPSEILNNLHADICEVLKQKGNSQEFGAERRDGMDVAICAFDGENRELQYAGAFRPLYYFRNNELTEIKADKFSIGGVTAGTEKIFTNNTLPLQKGDTFYIFSDGYADQFNAAGKKLMTKTFKEQLALIQAQPMEDQKKHLDKFFTDWKSEAEQTDDVLVIGIRI